jgi:peptidase E
MVKLVAAGRGITIAHPSIMNHVLSLSGKLYPRVVYLGTPSKDSDEHWRSTGLPYARDAGLPVVRLQLWNSTECDMAKERPRIQEILFHSDIIVVSGGSSRECISKWKSLHVDPILLSAAFQEDGPVLAGGSAGALCWFGGNGLGIVPFLLVPHFDNNFIQRGILSPEDSLRRFTQFSSCVCLDENAAMIISSSGLEAGHTNNVQTSFVTKKVNRCQEYSSWMTRDSYRGVIHPRDFPSAEATIVSTDGTAKGYLVRRESMSQVETLDIGIVQRLSRML